MIAWEAKTASFDVKTEWTEDIGYLISVTGGTDITATLPKAASRAGQVVYFYIVAIPGDNLVLTPASGDTVNGETVLSSNTATDCIALCSDGGTDWLLVGETLGGFS